MASIYSSVSFFLISYICITYSIPCTAVKTWERNFDILPPGSSAIEGKFQKREQKTVESSNSRRTYRSSTPQSFGAKEIKKFAEECLAAHNQYRQKHNVNALQLSEKLNKNSQKRADQIAKTKSFQHGDSNPYGENLYISKSSRKLDTLYVNGSDPVKSWYEKEVKLFKFGKKDADVTKTGHFSQIVWAGSKSLGVGVSKSSDGNTLYVVCQYDPPGNMKGKYDVNVPPVGGRRVLQKKPKGKN